MNYLILY